MYSYSYSSITNVLILVLVLMKMYSAPGLERETIIVVLQGRGAGHEVVKPVSHPRHLHSCSRHEREDMAAVREMINCFEVSLFMYVLLLLLSCIKYAINWH